MAGINNENIAKRLGMDEKSYRVLEEKDGDWFAMDAGEWLRVVDEQRVRRSWSLRSASSDTTQEMMNTTYTPEESGLQNQSETNHVKKVRLPLSRNRPFFPGAIVIRRAK